MTDQQRLDTANRKYDEAVASPSVSMYPGAGNIAVAKVELEVLLWDLRKMRTFTETEVNLIRQWYNMLADTIDCLDQDDHELGLKIGGYSPQTRALAEKASPTTLKAGN